MEDKLLLAFDFGQNMVPVNQAQKKWIFILVPVVVVVKMIPMIMFVIVVKQEFVGVR